MGRIHMSVQLSFDKINIRTKFYEQLYCWILNVKNVMVSYEKNAPPKGVSSVEDETVRNNLMGVSSYMNKKGWVDAQGRKGKGYGVYRYANKYGTNIDGYSPIYSPDEWSETGNTFSLGTKGLLAWAGLFLVLLGVGINLVVSTSKLG